MTPLHPLVWLGIGASLALLPLTTTNWLVSLLALACTVLVSRACGGPRTRAFAIAAAAGGIGLLVHLVLGALAGAVPQDPTVLAFLPERDLGQGVTIGGPYTVEQLAVSVERGLDTWALAAVVGLLWQACPGSRWCDLAQAVFGRGSQLLAPGLLLGESLARPGPRAPGRAVAVVEANRQLCDAWRTHARPSRPDWRHALAASVLGLVVAGGVYWVAVQGGLPVRVSDDRVVVVTAPRLLGGTLLAWCALRYALGPRPGPAPRRADAVAALGCAAVGAGLVLAGWTGDAPALAAEPDRWPPLPPVLSAALAVALALWVATTTATTRSRP